MSSGTGTETAAAGPPVAADYERLFEELRRYARRRLAHAPRPRFDSRRLGPEDVAQEAIVRFLAGPHVRRAIDPEETRRILRGTVRYVVAEIGRRRAVRNRTVEFLHALWGERSGPWARA